MKWKAQPSSLPLPWVACKAEFPRKQLCKAHGPAWTTCTCTWSFGLLRWNLQIDDAVASERRVDLRSIFREQVRDVSFQTEAVLCSCAPACA